MLPSPTQLCVWNANTHRDLAWAAGWWQQTAAVAQHVVGKNETTHTHTHTQKKEFLKEEWKPFPRGIKRRRTTAASWRGAAFLADAKIVLADQGEQLAPPRNTPAGSFYQPMASLPTISLQGLICGPPIRKMRSLKGWTGPCVGVGEEETSNESSWSLMIQRWFG